MPKISSKIHSYASGDLIRIGRKMRKAGLSKDFVGLVVDAALEFEGVYDLLKMWDDEDDHKERQKTVDAIGELLKDIKNNLKLLP